MNRSATAMGRARAHAETMVRAGKGNETVRICCADGTVDMTMKALLETLSRGQALPPRKPYPPPQSKQITRTILDEYDFKHDNETFESLWRE